MKMIKITPMCILLFTGYLCNAQEEQTTVASPDVYSETPSGLSPPRVGGKHIRNSSLSSAPEREESDHAPGGSLSALVVAGVSIALVLLFILIVGVFWYAWKKSQEGSIEINPIPYGEAGASLRTFPVPEN